MAQGKKSFVLYSDQKELFEHLPDEQAGKLIKHILAYVNDEEPETDDPLVNLAFISIKSALKRDLKRWEQQREQRSKAGKKSAESRKKKPTKSNERSTVVNETERKATVNGNVSVNVNDNVKEKKEPLTPKGESFDFDTYLEKLNELFGRQFKVINQSVKRKMNGTLKEYTKDNVWIAMKNCKNDPHHIEHDYKYCTPEFFARKSTLERHGDKLRGKPKNQIGGHAEFYQHD